MKGLGVVFTHVEGISTPRARHTGRQPLIECANMTSKWFIFPFLCLFVLLCFFMFLYFLSFCGRQWCFPCSYVSSIGMRKSYLHSSLRTKRLLSCFYLFFARYILTEKKSFKALDHLNDILILLKGEKR